MNHYLIKSNTKYQSNKEKLFAMIKADLVKSNQNKQQQINQNQTKANQNNAK